MAIIKHHVVMASVAGVVKCQAFVIKRSMNDSRLLPPAFRSVPDFVSDEGSNVCA